MSVPQLSSAAVRALDTTFGGELLTPADEGYDEARRVWNGVFDARRPAVVARCTDTADVVAAIALARESDAPLAVRGGGHSAGGYGTCDDGVVVDLSPMKGIEVDPVSRTVRAQPGLTWAEFDAATQAHGLAVTGGRFSTTGVAGLTLGSGSGWLERKCGLTCDNLLSAEVVTADGEVITASPDENAHLFWGLRGGGGNFGIVTSFEFRLHEIGPIIYGGLLAWAPEHAGTIVRCARDIMAGAPEDLGLAVAFISAPPEPFVPAAMQLQPAVGAVVCWTGDHAEGERLIAPLREAADPAVDMVQPMPYTALQSMLDAGGPKGTRAYMKAEFLGDLDDEVIEKFVAHGAARPGPMVQLLLEPLGGAIRRLEEDDAAISRRDEQWCYHALALWMDPADDEAHIEWARRLAEDVAPSTMPGVYLNFTSDTGEERVRSTYGEEKYARLVALKDRYDPTNVFRLNQNIRPSRDG